MRICRLDNLDITLEKKGATRFDKVTYPIRYGRYHEIKSPEYLFEFNLNGEIKFIRGLKEGWLHPAEWIKRTDANDWVYYSTGAYNEVISFLGEYYRPCLPYPSNSPWQYDPLGGPEVEKALRAWSELQTKLRTVKQNGIPAPVVNALTAIAGWDSKALAARSEQLRQIIGAPVSVLPPDCRHIDYEAIPLMIADGCLYQCGFCCIKTRQRFHPRSRENILGQIGRLKKFYGANLKNYNALFLGNHDALAAGGEIICMAAEEAWRVFDFQSAYIDNPTLFMFGSADSLLKADFGLFEALNRLPYYTYINIGLESADADTLLQLGKPLTPRKIKAAFETMIAVNRSCHKIEITANFLLGGGLPAGHLDALTGLIRDRFEKPYSKGAVYLSPFGTEKDKDRLLATFLELKNLSRLPVYIYLIQRLWAADDKV
jgi:hypothetical protein